jgi:hypothetical protein
MGVEMGIADYISIKFQDGTVREVGENGCQVQDVLDVCIQHLRSLNAVLPCRETSLAITKMEEGQLWLNERTRRRIVQGVEGTMVPHK